MRHLLARSYWPCSDEDRAWRGSRTGDARGLNPRRRGPVERFNQESPDAVDLGISPYNNRVHSPYRLVFGTDRRDPDLVEQPAVTKWAADANRTAWQTRTLPRRSLLASSSAWHRRPPSASTVLVPRINRGIYSLAKYLFTRMSGLSGEEDKNPDASGRSSLQYSA
jgi:hypothetical protein